MQILNSYSKASGQRINLTKSSIIGGKWMAPRIKIKMAEILQISLWDNPGKYLGLPSEWGRSRNSALSWIKEKIFLKLQGWKECILNQVGKEVLIKAVIQAIPSYAMAVVRFPKSFCKSICASVARFFWRSRGRDRGIHWKNWQVLTQNKSNGGLGFKEFADMNSALLAKQAWRVIENPESLWVKALKACYFPRDDFVRAKRRRGDSWVWASLQHGRDVVLKSARWSVGDGERIRIGEDSWLASGQRIHDALPPDVRVVADILDTHNKGWNIGRIRELFSPETVIQILQTPIAWQGERTSCGGPMLNLGTFLLNPATIKSKTRKPSYHKVLPPRLLFLNKSGALFGKFQFPRKSECFFGNFVLIVCL